MRKENRKAGCNVVRFEGDPCGCPPARAVAGAGSSQGGFSLVEVLVATGVAAAVLISISGLFILGTQNVVSGGNLSAATSLGQSMLEEMRGFSSGKMYGMLDGHQDDYLITWSTDQPNPVYTAPNDADADEYNAVLDAWRQEVREALPNGQMILTVEGFDNRPNEKSDGTATYGTARFLRIQVTIHWVETRGHGRQVTMNLLKF